MPAENLSPVQELAALRASAVTAAAELKAANDLLNEANGQITALTGERDLVKADVTRLTGELATAKTELTALTGKFETASADLAKANKRLESPSAEAAAICAAAGVDALAIRPGATVKGSAETDRAKLMAQANAIEDPKARAEFLTASKLV